MDQNNDETGIKIYTASPKTVSTNVKSLPVAPKIAGSKRRAVANGVQNTLSKTSTLANFLPTGTLLTFEMILPSVYKDGECTHVSTFMIMLLLCLCTLSCFFFHFTDSFKGPNGKVYYGMVTPKGLAVFKPDLAVEVPKDEKYRLGFSDIVHALMSAMVFGAIAMADNRVGTCLFPKHVNDMEQVMESLPLMVGVICSALFLVFPTTRRGIGCMAN